MRALALLALLSGCAAPIDRARVPEAAALVWNFYGETSLPPAIYFVEQTRLNCNPGRMTGRMYGYFYSDTFAQVGNDGQCVTGQFFFSEFTAQLALRDGDNYSTTSLAHEFYHAHLDVTTGDPDYEHTNPGFKSGGVVEDANEQLRLSGL